MSSKIKQSNGYMQQLDGLRFFAVGAVMVGHWLNYDAFKAFIGFFASAGVNLFFVLSGFLISLILFKSKDSKTENSKLLLKKFYVRRFLRIFPLYYLIIFLGFVFSIPNIRESLYWFLTYTANILISQNGGNSWYFTHLWSLCVEEQFYLVFPFIVLFIKIENYKKFFWVMIITGVLSRLIVCHFLYGRSNMEWTAYALTPCCLDSFGIGAFLAYLFNYNRNYLEKILRYSWIFILLFFISISLVLLSHVYTDLQIISIAVVRTAISLFSFWIIGLGSLNKLSGITKALVENKTIIYLGKISYGLYVYHHFMPYLFDRFGYFSIARNRFMNFALFFPATVIISSASWYFFENPINKLKRYFSYSSLPKVTA